MSSSKPFRPMRAGDLKGDLGRVRWPLTGLHNQRNALAAIAAAQHLGVGQSRVSDLVRGKYDKFSLDMLVTLATRAGGTCLIRALDSGGDTAGFL